MNQIRVHQLETDVQRVSDIQFDILIDGVSFLELVRQYELPFAGSLAGSYALYSIPTKNLGYFMGDSETGLWYPVLGCECGFVDCWPLYAKIYRTEKRIEWNTFEQPHRKDEWDYSTFGPFAFE